MLNINITIQADAEGTFTGKEQDILNALAGTATVTAQVGDVKVTEPAKAETAAPAAPEKPKRTRRTKAEIEAEKAAKAAAEAEAEEEPKTLQEELAEDGDDDGEEDLRAKVVELAGQMVSGGNPAGVRSALQSVGAKKVSEVKDKDLQTLFDAMELNN